MKKKQYEIELGKLQIELAQLQEWVKDTGYKAIVVFEGRDAAGKGGVIKAITQRLSPRVFRVEALPAPSDREKTQIFIQRYISRFPAAGEIMIFDRSWYNRAGVEIVMGFCTEQQRGQFLESCPRFEEELVLEGMELLKYWLEVSPQEQKKRFEDRIKDPAKNWKLSPMDLEARRCWYEYSLARDKMLDATDTEIAPWNIVNNTDKRRGRLNCIAHLLSQIPYERVDSADVELVGRSKENAYDDTESMEKRTYVPDLY